MSQRNPASARFLCVAFAVFVATIMTVPTRVIAEEVAPEGPKASMTPGEREEFLQYWLDVFARGTRPLNETPDSYYFEDALKMSLIDDLIIRLKQEAPEIARQFEPAVAGPMLGISSPEAPLIAPDGSTITQEQVDAIYGSFIGGIIFDRANFVARLESLLDPLQPDASQFPPAPSEGEVDARNEIREALEQEPFFEWANDLLAPTPPEGFVTDLPEVTEEIVVTVPADLSDKIPTSPMGAAPASAWLDPDFHLALPNLLDFLATLTDIETDDLLRELGLLATTSEVVDTIEGSLEDFPVIAGPVGRIAPIADMATAALVRLDAPLPLKVRATAPTEELPPEAIQAMEAAGALAQSTQYVVVVNGVAFQGTWETPLPIDVDADGVVDAVVDLGLAAPTVGIGDATVERVPLFRLQRVDAIATARATVAGAQTPDAPGTPEIPAPAVAVGATTDGELSWQVDAPALPEVKTTPLPASALSTLDLAVAFKVPETGTVVGYVASAENGLDALEIALTDASPAIGITTVGGSGAFQLAAAVAEGDALHIVAVDAPNPPASASVSAAIDAASGVAMLDAQAVSADVVSLAGIHATPTSRLALGASGSGPDVVITSDGTEIEVSTLDGSALRIDRQEGVAGSATTFTARVLILNDAPASLSADLGDERLRFETATAGRDVTMLVGSVVNGAFDGGAWAEIAGAGKRATLSLEEGVDFASDRNVDRLRAVRADSGAAALAGNVPAGVLYARDDLLAYSLDDVRTTTATPTGTGFDVELVSDSSDQFLMLVDRPGDFQQYLLSNLPHQASFGLSPEGLSIGASEMVASVAGYIVRDLEGGRVPPTTTVLAATNVRGTAAVTMADASVNTFLTGSVASLNVLSSNVPGPRGPIFASLPGQHTFADVNGLLHQHSAGLTNAAGSITGGLFGPLGTITIEMSIAGQLCQVFGRDDTKITICISNVPSRIDLTLAALPSPRIVYDATAVIGQISLRVEAPAIDVSFAIQQIPRHIELLLAGNSMTLTSDTRLGGLVFTGAVGTTTLGAGMLDLPRTLTLTWGSGGVSPSFPAGDAIGRVYLFVSQPGLSFNVDIVHLPPSVLSWNANSFSFGPAAGDRIGSATVQLFVADLQFVTQAAGIPGMSVGWNTAGGTLSTTGTLDSVMVNLVKGPVGTPSVSLYTALTGVPQLVGNWGTGSVGLTLPGASKIQSFTFQFTAGDLLLYASASGVPSTTLTMSGGGFTVSAPNAIDLITLVLAKGSGYYDPWSRTTDFAGLYLRPDLARFGISARVSGIKSLSYTKNDVARTQAVTVGFTTDKSFQVLADLDSAALTAYADMLLTNLAATTTFTIDDDGVSLSGTPINPSRPGPWIQALVEVGTPSAYDAMPAPRWPWETAGDYRGIMGNTMVDTVNPGVATKWKVYAPLPNVLTFNKVTSGGMPTSYSLNTGVSLGKLDLRTNLKVNLNLCGGCSPYYLNTLAVATVSNLPTSFSVSEGLGAGSTAGSPSFSISTAQSINKLFLGLRFDGAWYATGDETGGFPIWATLGQIPTSVGLTVSKAGGWSSGNTPAFSYSANANTLDASMYLNIGQLWTMFAKPTIINAAAAGRQVPGWLVGLAQMDAKGYLLIQVVDIPAAGIAMYRSGQTIVVDPLGSTPLTKFFADFNLRFEKNMGDSGCWICGVIQLDWWWSFGYYFEINQLSLLLENLRYVSIDPAIDTVVVLDGHLVFHFRASVGINFSAGIRLSINILGLSWTLICICVPPVSLSAMVDPGFISFQVNTYSWSVNYLTLGFFCHFFEPWYEPWAHAWCETHWYAGVTYTIPTNWQWDLPIAAPPLVPFRGLNLYSGTHHVILNPRILNCVGSVCWEVGRLVPVEIVMAYAYLRYFSISGVNWWSTDHTHWF